MNKQELKKMLEETLRMERELIEWAHAEIRAHFNETDEPIVKEMFDSYVEEYTTYGFFPSLAQLHEKRLKQIADAQEWQDKVQASGGDIAKALQS